MSETTDRSVMFRALGDPTRLRIFEFLRAQCCPVVVEDTGEVRPVLGPTVGEVCCQVLGADKITSSLSFHLKELRLAGLITMEKRGKHVLCGINRETVAGLAAYLGDAMPAATTGDCCE